MSAASAPVSAPAPTPASDRLRVLVVDDEPAIGRLLSAVLGHHDIMVLGSGAAALERLRTDHAFDIVICDLMMPSVTGIDVYTAAAEEHPGLERRFIFITGGAFTERARSFIESVPNRRLDKPFTIRALELAMAETVAEARTA